MYQPLNEGKRSIDTLFAMAAGAANAATGAVKNKSEDKPYSYSSIAKAASKLVAVFPVLASRTVSPDTARMVSKYIEQKACNLFMLALQQANISSAKNGIEYLRNYHQNLDLGGDNVNAIISTMQTWLDAYESGKIAATNESATEDDFFEFNEMFNCDRDLVISSLEMKNLLEVMKECSEIKFYDTKLNPISINDYVVREFEDGTYHVSIGNYEAFQEAKGSSGLRSNYRNGNYANRADAAQAQADADADSDYAYQQKKRQWEEDDRRAAQAREYAKERERQEEKEAQKAKEEKEERELIKSRQLSKNVSILKDQDIKKMNEAVPSLLVVKFYSSETASVATEFIIGVKSKLIPVTTTEVLRRIMNDNKDGKKFINFMRTITGEMKASELIFAFSRIKDDALSTKNKGAYGNVWNLLANRADAANTAVKHGKHNDFSAITTVVISQADADELYREENFDIGDPKNALHFMKSYNLMSFVIVDDATETLKILMDDGEKLFSEYAYRNFERETEDGTYKKLINLMAASK